MAATEKRGAFTDPWGREFLSDGTMVKGQEGNDKAAEDVSEDQLSEDNDGASAKAEPAPPSTGGKMIRIKFKVTPNLDGPESEEETAGSGRPRPPPAPGGKTLPTTKLKTKEVLSIRDPPCWRCKTLNKPCESSSLRFSCTTCYKRHWACSMNPPPPRQKKGGGSSHHSAPPKTRSLPATGTAEAVGTADIAGDSISAGPVTRGRSPLRSASSKGPKRPRSPTPPPNADDVAAERSGPLEGVSAPQNKKTRTSLRTISKPPAPSQSQPQRPQSKNNGGGSPTPATNQGSVRPISISSATQSQPYTQTQSTHKLIQAQTQFLSQTYPLTSSEVNSLQSQIETLIQRDEKSHAILEQHSAMLDAVLANMRVLLGNNFVDVGAKEKEGRPLGASAEPSVQTGKVKRNEDGRDDKALAPILSITRSTAQEAETEEFDELDELTPIEKLNPTPILNGIGGTAGVAPGPVSSTAASANGHTVDTSIPTTNPSSGLVGPAVAGTLDPQRVDRPPRVISVPSARAPSRDPVQAPIPLKPPVLAQTSIQAPVPTRDSLPPSTASSSKASAPPASVHNGTNVEKPKPKPKGTNPYPNISAVSSAPPSLRDSLPRAIIKSSRMAHASIPRPSTSSSTHSSVPANIPTISTLPAISALPTTPLSPASTTSAVDEEGAEGGYVADASHGPTPALIPSTVNQDGHRSRSRSPLPRSRSPLLVSRSANTSRSPFLSSTSHVPHESRSYQALRRLRTSHIHSQRRPRSPFRSSYTQRRSSLSPSPPLSSHSRYGYAGSRHNDTRFLGQSTRRSMYPTLSRSVSRSRSRSPPSYALPHVRDSSDMHIDHLVEPYPIHSGQSDHLDRQDRLDLGEEEDSRDLVALRDSILHDANDLNDLEREPIVDAQTGDVEGNLELGYPADDMTHAGDVRNAHALEAASDVGDEDNYSDQVRYSSSR